ncbi:MAG: hypothetical protein PWP27_395 [Clostridiales bacterium]|nr:hypothetical protein [Clostridiales bacterium]
MSLNCHIKLLSYNVKSIVFIKIKFSFLWLTLYGGCHVMSNKLFSKNKLSTFHVFFGLFFVNSLIVLGVIWIFFTFFSHRYYTHEVINSFIQDSQNHEKLYDEIGHDKYLNELYSYEVNKESRIILFDSNTNHILYPEMVPKRGMGQRGFGNAMETYELINTIVENLKQKGDENVLYYRHHRTNIETLIIYRQWNNGIIWIAQSAIQPIDRAVDIFQTLFFWFGLLGLVLSSILAWILSNKITHNVSKINEKVMNIASLAFEDSKKIPVGFSKELETLGTTLNIVSDKLRDNIVALKNTNLRLKQELEKEKQLDTIRKQFITDVSHDLKTPISIIQGYAEGLLDGISDDPLEYIHAIRDEAFYMKNLVDSLLELARLESEQSFIKFQNVNVTKLVSDIKKRFISSAKKYNRKVSFKITNESLWCDGNPVKLTQAFENLLKNSIMHGNPEGEIIIKLQKQNDIFFSVYNDAPPIPNEEIPLIFERFYKLDRSRNRQIGGTGLGLSIVKNIILKHGGKVGVKNEGNGVKFWISLPIKMIR